MTDTVNETDPFREWKTVADAAAELDVSVSTVHKAVKAGTLHSHAAGRTTFVNMTQSREWVKTVRGHGPKITLEDLAARLESVLDAQRSTAAILEAVVARLDVAVNTEVPEYVDGDGSGEALPEYVAGSGEAQVTHYEPAPFVEPPAFSEAGDSA